MKKRFSILLCAILSVFLLVGCGGKKDGKKKITVATNLVGVQAELLQELTNEFMVEHPEIEVEFNSIGQNYENIMKTKMAAKDMPDIFSTHGWAILRYGEFLEDLRDEKWAKDIAPAIKPMVVDDEGKVYVLPFDVDKTGIIYNAGILKKYGLEVPKTWDDFVNVCKVIKEKSNGTVTPVHIGGADEWPLGNFFDFFAAPLYITDPENSQADQLLSGNFDWKNWDILPEMMMELYKNNLLNKDVLTAKYQDTVDEFTADKVAFGIYGPYLAQEVVKKNPSVDVAMMPVPAFYEGDEPTLIGGERSTFGVWKDSENKEAAKEYLRFMARPENVEKVATASSLPAGLVGVESDMGKLTESFNTYENARVFPYFDRIYLPNGMWDVMCKNGQELLAGNIDSKEYSENMKSEFNRLFKK
jgi:raffinose/stachyose/melibiose transport system substrate-binding protein